MDFDEDVEILLRSDHESDVAFFDVMRILRRYPPDRSIKDFASLLDRLLCCDGYRHNAAAYMINTIDDTHSIARLYLDHMRRGPEFIKYIRKHLIGLGPYEYVTIEDPRFG